MNDVILVDEHDNQIGTGEKMSVHEQGLLHRAFSVFLLGAIEGRPHVLLQQRAASKYHCPMLWTNTCCSHPRPHETVFAAATRRLNEELGINQAIELKSVGSFVYRAEFDNGLVEHEYDHVLVGNIELDIPLKLNKDEVAAVRFADLKQLQLRVADSPEFTPWYPQAAELVLDSL